MPRLPELISAVLAVDPDAPAIQFQGRWHSWADLSDMMEGVERALSGSGVVDDTRIAVVLRNRPEVMGAIVAAHHANACLVALNGSLPDPRLSEEITKAAAPVLVGWKDDIARGPVLEAGRKLGALILDIDLQRPRGERVAEVAPRRPGRAVLREKAPGIAMEMLTSGTTGPPKRIPIPREHHETGLFRRQAYEKKAASQGAQLSSGVQILSSPFAHAAGVGQAMAAVTTGRKVCLLSKFSVDEVRAAIREHRPKVMSLPPAAWRMIFDADVPAEDLASLKAARAGTAPLDPDFADAFQQRYGFPILQNYGSTETGGVAGWTIEDWRQFGSAKRGAVGRINSDVDARVVSPETGEPLANGELGLLELRSAELGPNWVRTTDLARLDNDRFLWICGRHDGAIIRGGFKLQPEEIARALEGHPAVKEAVVVGIADARLGQVPAAAFVAARGALQTSEAELLDYLRQHLLPYQLPVTVMQVEEFPRTVSLKVDQRALAEVITRALEPAAG